MESNLQLQLCKFNVQTIGSIVTATQKYKICPPWLILQQSAFRENRKLEGMGAPIEVSQVFYTQNYCISTCSNLTT